MRQPNTIQIIFDEIIASESHMNNIYADLYSNDDGLPDGAVVAPDWSQTGLPKPAGTNAGISTEDDGPKLYF